MMQLPHLECVKGGTSTALTWRHPVILLPMGDPLQTPVGRLQRLAFRKRRNQARHKIVVKFIEGEGKALRRTQWWSWPRGKEVYTIFVLKP
jgi:hypothetical protein